MNVPKAVLPHRIQISALLLKKSCHS